METFTSVWEEWIDLNLSLGNCKKIMFQKSLEAGYSYNLLKRKIGIDYISPETRSSRIHNTIALGTAQRLNVKNLEIYAIPNFLTPDECSKIISIINASELTTSSTYIASNPTERCAFR